MLVKSVLMKDYRSYYSGKLHDLTRGIRVLPLVLGPRVVAAYDPQFVWYDNVFRISSLS
jgi:hypothetical protein